VGEIGNRTGAPLQGIWREAGQPATSPPPLDPHGVTPPFGAITVFVAAIRFAAPATPFRRPRGVRKIAIRRRSTGSSRRLGLPFRAHRQIPAGVLRGSSDPHGVSRPYNDINAEIYLIRVSNPGTFRLQGFSPS